MAYCRLTVCKQDLNINISQWLVWSCARHQPHAGCKECGPSFASLLTQGNSGKPHALQLCLGFPATALLCWVQGALSLQAAFLPLFVPPWNQAYTSWPPALALYFPMWWAFFTADVVLNSTESLTSSSAGCAHVPPKYGSWGREVIDSPKKCTRGRIQPLSPSFLKGIFLERTPIGLFASRPLCCSGLGRN